MNCMAQKACRAGCRPQVVAAAPRHRHYTIRRHIPATAAIPAAAVDINPLAYLDADVAPQAFVGPVTVADIPGKGRGLVATEQLEPGQLLLVVPPLVLVEGGLGEIPEHDELQEVITSSGALYSPWQVAWLKALTTTTASNSSTDTDAGDAAAAVAAVDATLPRSQQQQAAMPSLLPPPEQAAWYGSSGSNGDGSDGSSATGRVPFNALGMSEDQLWAAIVLNCYGEMFPDLPASLCAQAPISSQLGLWGPFSMLNHSCCPNAINYTLRDCMVVRCAAAVPSGAELCINYLGRSALRPFSQRQTELEASYGFRCSCNRCQTETQWSSVTTQTGMTVEAMLDKLQRDLWEQHEPLLMQLQADLSNGEIAPEQQQQLAGQSLVLANTLRQQWQELQAAFPCSSNHTASSSGGGGERGGAGEGGGCGGSSRGASQGVAAAAAAHPSQEATWALACAFDLLGCLYEALECARQPDLAVSDAMLHVCQQVCPGSDLHLFQALRRTSLAQQLGAEQGSKTAGGLQDKLLQQNMQPLIEALHVRYGDHVVKNEELLSKMVAATSQAASMVSF